MKLQNDDKDRNTKTSSVNIFELNHMNRMNHMNHILSTITQADISHDKIKHCRYSYFVLFLYIRLDNIQSINNMRPVSIRSNIAY